MKKKKKSHTIDKTERESKISRINSVKNNSSKKKGNNKEIKASKNKKILKGSSSSSNDKKLNNQSNKVNMSEIKEIINRNLYHGESFSNLNKKSTSKNAITFTKSEKGKKKKGREKSKQDSNYLLSYIPGLDRLFERGIPQGSSVIIAGGAGSGKTILSLQILFNHAIRGKKCLYLSFEESEERLKSHMRDFGWNPEELIKKGNLKISRTSPFEISRNIDALLAKEKGELLIDIDPVITPKGFKPDLIVIDSLTAIGSAFSNKSDSYRIYIEQLFRFLEKSSSTSFLITETEQIPKVYSASGVEEFLADGVIVLYNIKNEDARENALEILKMRGEKHLKKLVAMRVTDNGIMVYPDQEIFSDIG